MTTGNDFVYDILSKERKKLLPLFSEFKNTFYLAGGTGLALQIGHRDSIDLYFISQKIGLETLLNSVEKKFPPLDLNLVLKSLVYFDDLVEEPINYKNNNEVDFELIKAFFKGKLKNYFA